MAIAKGKLSSNKLVKVTHVYSFHKGWRGSIIAINQLPTTDETLWLRVLGKGKVQRHAVDELLALPDTKCDSFS